MSLASRIAGWFGKKEKPGHLQRGEQGETLARQHLRQLGLKFLTANFKSKHGEIDLIFRDGDCLVFVEVKTRAHEDWVRPAAAVNARKRKLLSRTANDYLDTLDDRRVKYRFDIVEVLLDDAGLKEIRHLPNIEMRRVSANHANPRE